MTWVIRPTWRRAACAAKKNLVGLIMPDIAYPFAIEVMKGVNRAIAESEFDLLVYTTGDVRKSGTSLPRTKVCFPAHKFHF
jgi:DNA-binding LacI/PurR family transcriptional regulator